MNCFHVGYGILWWMARPHLKAKIWFDFPSVCLKTAFRLAKESYDKWRGLMLKRRSDKFSKESELPSFGISKSAFRFVTEYYDEERKWHVLDTSRYCIWWRQKLRSELIWKCVPCFHNELYMWLVSACVTSARSLFAHVGPVCIILKNRTIFKQTVFAFRT